MSHSTTTTTSPSRFRPNSKTKPSPSPKQESVSPDVKTNGITTKTRRSLVLNRPKSSEDALGSKKLDEVKVLDRSANRPVVEQFARPRRPRSTDACSGKNNEDGVVNKEKKELEEKLSLSENLVKDLRAEVLALKTELDKAQSLNAEMEKQKNKLADDLVLVS